MGPHQWGWPLNSTLIRGDLLLADLEPAVGSEVSKTRPCVVVSNNRANLTSPTVTVVPITSNTAWVYPFQVFLPREVSGLDLDSKAQAEQVRTLDRSCMGRKLGQLSPELLRELDAALKLHLGLG
ncbi:mRNA interferase [Deinococcus saxicola]